MAKITKREREEEERDERLMKLLHQHANQMSEHFDTVQIVVTNHHGEHGTMIYTAGIGNWYARKGSMIEWLERSHQ